MVGYITLFIWSAALFVVLVSVVFPRLFLKMKCSVKTSEDRGIERIKGEGFCGIVYLPRPSLRDKIDRYVIEEKNGGKFLRLNFAKPIRYIDYDVIVFAESGEVLDVLRVKEVPKSAEYSEETRLPDLTAYVSISVNETDSGTGQSLPTFRVPWKRIFLYCLFTVLAIVVEAIAVKFCLANIFGGIFNESFMMSETFLITGGIIGVLALVSVITLGIFARRRAKR